MMRGFVLVFTLAGAPRAQPADRWLGQDKLKHFFTAAFVQSFGYGSLRAAGASHGVALTGATTGTVAVSLGKEVWDARGHGTPSVKDAAWDAAGAGAATALLVKVQR
jgi:putative lipoprotein